MGFKKLFGFGEKEKKHYGKEMFGERHVAYHKVGQPQWTPRRYENLVKEGFCRNVIVYRVVTMIAKSVGSIPLQAQENTSPLLEKPNPIQDWAHFIEDLVSSYLLSGNGYVSFVTHKNGAVAEMYVLRPDRVKVQPGAGSVPSGYLYEVGNHKKVFPVDALTGRSQILHMKTIHPLNDWYGLSPIEAAAQAIDQHNAVSGHNLALLQNGGRPSGALIVDTQLTHLSDEQRQELREGINALFTGGQNAGRPLILEGAFKWQEMGLTPKDLDFIDGKKMSGREIAQAFGVPPMLVGIPGEATFANFREARFHLWEETILPLATKLLGSLSQWLVAEGALSSPLAFDLDQIQALQPKRDALWARISNSTFLTDNEKRALLGFPPIADQLANEVVTTEQGERP